MAITITIGITVLERNRPFSGITSYRGVTELSFTPIPPPTTGFILLEDGSYILQEGGSKILLE